MNSRANDADIDRCDSWYQCILAWAQDTYQSRADAGWAMRVADDFAKD